MSISKLQFPGPAIRQRQAFGAGIFLLVFLVFSFVHSKVAAQTPPTVKIGLDAEFGLDNSTSAQAIELGLRAAIHEINSSGGVLQGRHLELVTKDHRSIPARGIRNITEFAEMRDLVAVFGGRFSPVVIEQLPVLKATRLPFMAVWSSADTIVDNGMVPNYIFRLSLRDSLAMPKMLQASLGRGMDRVGLLLTNTSWGRSNLAAAQQYAERHKRPEIVQTVWYNWRDASLVDKYKSLVKSGAQAIILVANDDEAATLVREMAMLPPDERVPILSHWGITGGEFVRQAGPALQQVDLSVIQTFNFFQADAALRNRFMKTLAKISDIRRVEDIKGPVGVAHAYDLMHILAKAIDVAGSTDRSAIRDALEKVRNHQGLIKSYAAPFTPQRHEALGPDELLMARYRMDGTLVPSGH